MVIVSQIQLLSARYSKLSLTYLDQSKRKKRSRYSTLPDEVDEALATINRQLEAGIHLKTMLEHATARNQALEQELQIERSKALLASRNEQTVAEMNALRTQFNDLQHEFDDVTEQNQRLKTDAEKHLKKIKDLEAWKLRMKSMIEGDSEDQEVSNMEI
jgi:predicted  nucleic acid-binding Zn-ribbon protein